MTRPDHREHHGSAMPWASPRPVLLATRARVAGRAMWCVLCSRAIVPPERCADLADGRGVAHAGCIGAMAAAGR